MWVLVLVGGWFGGWLCHVGYVRATWEASVWLRRQSRGGSIKR